MINEWEVIDKISGNGYCTTLWW